MPDIETPDSDALEQQQEPDIALLESGPELSPETPEADAVEQQIPLRDSPRVATGARTVEADEGDLAESEREVPFDDDDYR